MDDSGKTPSEGEAELRARLEKEIRAKIEAEQLEERLRVEIEQKLRQELNAGKPSAAAELPLQSEEQQAPRSFEISLITYEYGGSVTRYLEARDIKLDAVRFYQLDSGEERHGLQGGGSRQLWHKQTASFPTYPPTFAELLAAVPVFTQGQVSLRMDNYEEEREKARKSQSIHKPIPLRAGSAQKTDYSGLCGCIGCGTVLLMLVLIGSCSKQDQSTDYSNNRFDRAEQQRREENRKWGEDAKNYLRNHQNEFNR